MMRRSRGRFSALSVAIIGYTNVGKSTLMNALTGSGVVVRDKLFATLDPTVRKFTMPNRQKALFIDTVGFITDLPHHLVEAFKATLEEVVEADLLLHLVDASHPKALEQAEAVRDVLAQIGAAGKPMIVAINKTDKPGIMTTVEKLKMKFPQSLAISALKRDGFGPLIARVQEHMNGLTDVVTVDIPASDAGTLALIHENGLVRRLDYRGDTAHIEAEVPIRLKDHLESLIRDPR
jgi:GTP-binding protein HflX